MISLQLPKNQSYLDPGLMYLTDEGMWIRYDDDGEEVQLIDNDGYIFDSWEQETENFIRKVFVRMCEMDD